MEEFERIVYDVFAKRCTSRETLEHLTGRWGILVLAALSEGTYRFNELRRRVDGVSDKMLSQTLQALERDGMVLRVVEQTIPPKSEYSLTPLGAEAADRLVPLIHWLESRMPEVAEARERYQGR
ncbi:helix-turn-helix domain-containing protein [Actinocorallia longicatena]|uniref:Helix-turn-helix domain-containing protein n=1 Tax=Actinocorallia longicatena TaxID=111803 RepID=A0ABP6Q474_9ACTN